MRHLTILLLAVLATPFAHAGTPGDGATPVEADKDKAGETLVIQGRTLHPLHGTVAVGSGLASIEVPPNLFFLAREEARFVIETVCHNPEDPDIVGLVMPSAEEDTWMTVLSYDPQHGHVADSDAKSMDFAALLSEMQQSVHDGNAARKAAGYDTAELRGWAEPPHYDAGSHKLYWAKRLQFSTQQTETLNYCVRVLTRRGVLEMNTVGEPQNLAAVSVAAKDLLGKTTVGPDEQYEKFDSSIDKLAVGGIAALIAGGVLAKSGLLAVIGKFLLVMIKPLLIGVAVVGGWLWKVVTGRRESAEAEKAKHL